MSLDRCRDVFGMTPREPPPQAARSPGTTLVSIQVLRAVAAALVVIHHAGYDSDTIAARFGLAPLGLDRFFDWSFGIHLFFVISGLIMVRSARGFGRPGATAAFLGRRLLRIAPLYWLMTTLVLLGAAVAPSLLNVPVTGWRLLLGSYLFFPVTRIDGEIRPVLGQGWTLNYEMFFYVLFGLAMLLPRRAGLVALAAVLVALAAAGTLAPPVWPPATVWTDGLLLEFLFGILIGLGPEAGGRVGPGSARALTLTGVAAAVLLGPLGGDSVAELAPWIRGGLPAALIVAGCGLGPRWTLAGPVALLAVLGDASYSLYLTHPFAIRMLRVAWSATVAGRLPVWLNLAAAVLAACVVGLLVYRLIERPMTLALNRRLFGRPAAAAPPLPEAADPVR